MKKLAVFFIAIQMIGCSNNHEDIEEEPKQLCLDCSNFWTFTQSKENPYEIFNMADPTLGVKQYNTSLLEFLNDRYPDVSKVIFSKDEINYRIQETNLIKDNKNFDFVSLDIEDRRVVKKNNKYALADKEGELITEFTFQYMSFPSEQLVAVQKNNKWGFIDIDGNIVIDFEYDKAHYFVDGLAYVHQSGKSGYIDVEGDWIDVFEPEIKWGKGCEFEGFQYTMSGSWVFWIRNTAMPNMPLLIIPYTTFYRKPGEEDIFFRNQGEGYFVLDNKYIFDLKGRVVGTIASLAIENIGIIDKQSLNTVYLTELGEVFISDSTDNIKFKFRILDRKLYSSIRKGKINPNTLNQVVECANNILTIQKGDKQFLCNYGGEQVNNKGYDFIINTKTFDELLYYQNWTGKFNEIYEKKLFGEELNNKLYFVLDNDSLGIIDKSREIFSPKYSYLNFMKKKRVISQSNVGMNLYNLRGKQLLNQNYAMVYWDEAEKKYGVIKDNKRAIIRKGLFRYYTGDWDYQYRGFEWNGRKLVACDTLNGEKRFGYLNNSDELVIPIKFEKALPFKDSLAKVKEKGLYGYIDVNGKYVVPPEYLYIKTLEPNYYLTRNSDTAHYDYNEYDKIINIKNETLFAGDKFLLVDHNKNWAVLAKERTYNHEAYKDIYVVNLQTKEILYSNKGTANAFLNEKVLMVEETPDISILNRINRYLKQNKIKYYHHHHKFATIKTDYLNKGYNIDFSLKEIIDNLGNLPKDISIDTTDNSIVILKTRVFDLNNKKEVFFPWLIREHIYVDGTQGNFIASKDNVYGIINVNQDIIIPFEYTDIKDDYGKVKLYSSFNEETTIYDDELFDTKNNKGFKRISSNEYLSEDNNKIYRLPGNYSVEYLNPDKKIAICLDTSYVFYFYNMIKNEITPFPAGVNAVDYYDNMVKVYSKKDDKYHIIDYNGKNIFKSVYDGISNFNNGYAVAKINTSSEIPDFYYLYENGKSKKIENRLKITKDETYLDYKEYFVIDKNNKTSARYPYPIEKNDLGDGFSVYYDNANRFGELRSYYSLYLGEGMLYDRPE